MRPAAFLVALAVLFGVARAGAQPIATVQISSGAFSPRDSHVDEGGTIQFVSREAGHTVTADGCRANDPAPCRFDFPAPPQGTTEEGDTYEWRAPNSDVTVPYHCEIHSSMTGTITVGIGSPLPSPSPTPPPVFRDVPSVQFPTIQAGVDGAQANTIVRVAPGVYKESITVTSPGITIVGPLENRPVIEGENLRSTGIGVTANDVRLENLTVQNFRSDGVIFLSVEGFTVVRVIASGNKAHGIVARGSRRGTIDGASVNGSTDAAFMIAACSDCDIVLTNVYGADSRVGYLSEDAGGVVLRRSFFERNSTGVLLSTQLGSSSFPTEGTHVYGNILQNNNGAAPSAAPSTRLRAPSGVGIWVAGSWLDRIEGNTLIGHGRYGIALTILGAPIAGSRVTGNVVSGSGKADLAWDGLGVNVCFAGNEAATAEPAFLPTLYACGTHLPVGVPYPPVAAELLPPAAGLSQ